MPLRTEIRFSDDLLVRILSNFELDSDFGSFFVNIERLVDEKCMRINK